MLKSVVDVETEAQRTGTEVHKHFEDRLGASKPLPPALKPYEAMMKEVETGPGTIMVERKVGLTLKLEPCDFFAKDVWWRGIIDVHKVRPDGTSLIVDWKTGKPHNKMRQLWLFSLYGFIEGQVEVESMYYWTKTQTRTRIKLPRAQMPTILKSLVPDLTAYKQAYNLDLWPPKPNYLCKSYCGVTGCEFHGKGMYDR